MASKIPKELKRKVPANLGLSFNAELLNAYLKNQIQMYPQTPLDFTECQIIGCDGCRIFDKEYEFVEKNCLNLKTYNSIMGDITDRAFERMYGSPY